MPNLTEAKADTSIYSIKDKYLYAIGGFDRLWPAPFIATIERLPMINPTSPDYKWTKLEVALPTGLSKPGLMLVNGTNIFIYGGFLGYSVPATSLLKIQEEKTSLT